MEERAHELTTANAELRAQIAEREAAEAHVLRQNALLTGINRVLQDALTAETDVEVARACLSVAERLTGSKFGFIGELDEAGLFNTIVLSNPGWEACSIPRDESARLIQGMPVHGLDRSTMLEGRSRIVNDPARQAEKGTFSFSAQQPSAPEGDILLSREAACGAPLGGGKQNVPAVNVPFSALPEGHQEVACFLSVPLKRGSTTVGMIGLANKPGGYAEADLEAVEALSLAFAEALAHKRAEQTIARLSREQSNRLVELAALNRELEAFSYSVSHDLRAPLRAMDGFSRLLLREYAPLLDAEGRHYIERVRAASQRMVCLIDDLLQLSRITRDPMQPEGLDLTRLAEEAVGALRAAEPGRAAEVTIAPGVTARGDGRLMRIALDNLLGNAWKFTGKRPTAHIEFGVTATGEGKVYFVRDDGAGFDMAYAGKLFTPFQRLHSMEEFPGTGLGLATVQRVIQRHGGRVWAEGNPGHGATFCFTLPDHE